MKENVRMGIWKLVNAINTMNFSTCAQWFGFVVMVVVLIAAGVGAGNASESSNNEPATHDQDQKQTVFITGANRGLGLEFARQFSAAGWNVIGTSRRPDEAAELKALGVRMLQLDVADQASVDRLESDLGKQAVDLLINNAGIFPRVSTLAEVDFNDVSRTFAVNTLGPMRVTRALLPNLRLGAAKVIVNITSGLGSIADNESGRYYGYRESKAALNMFTRSLAAELSDEGFTVIVMSPGWVQTDMGGPNATLEPSQSIAGMRAVIDRLTPAENGTFWSYDGSRLPW
jgi:NAD(P)-dependent dehydrogenase (short-subunit alcohol dehydrogenase family)